MKDPSFIGVSKFKERCLSLLDSLEAEGLVITKHGRPIARVLPYPKEPQDLYGILKHKITIHGDVFSTGVSWDAAGHPDD
ncbi:MAG: type II toxin-antitoxin system prevent-host-death family antitoxin [Gammaproteobacteria bacterium]|nr:type II toxin-antitoxin system prevent-host-death family antitoxin [Gammaproteobacteria bacterium]